MGYSEGKEVPLYGKIKDARIELHWNDMGQTIKTFRTVQELADFLKSNPRLATEFGYVSKNQRPMTIVLLKLPDNAFSMSHGDRHQLIDKSIEVLREKGSVEWRKQIFTDEFQFNKFVKEIQGRR
jgi:hypothetical protein